MGLFDSEKLKGLKDKAVDTAKKAGSGIKDTAQKTAQGMKDYKAEADAAKAPVEGALRRYEVIYKGGLAEYPKAMSGGIGFNILPDSFVLKPTKSMQDKFRDMTITYEKISDFKIVNRTVSAGEALLADNKANLISENTMEIYYTEGDEEIVLRLEMLTGVTVDGQAVKCKEMVDFLRHEKILQKITAPAGGAAKQTADDIPAQLEKLAKLKERGILTEEEFNAKKAELLAKM